jgi:cystathionine beta-synthase
VAATAIPNNSLDLIGNTRMVELKGFETGECRLFLKLENENPGGSIKDRMAVSMIRAAEESGVLKPGGTIVEATAGNTGLGLALVAAAKGYKLILVLPDKMSAEKIAHLRAFGCDIRLTRSDVGSDHADYYMNIAARIAAADPEIYNVNQFKNEANPLAHEQTTGPEIWVGRDDYRIEPFLRAGESGNRDGVGRSAGFGACWLRESWSAGPTRPLRGRRNRAKLRPGDCGLFQGTPGLFHSGFREF